MNHRLMPLALALALAFAAGAAQAQLRATPDPGSLVGRVELPRPDLPPPTASGVANITTRAGVTRSATQESANTGANALGRQTLAVGSTVDLRDATGSIGADGQIDGAVLQMRTGAQAGVTTAQEIGVGTVGGSVTARDVQARGATSASITQLDIANVPGGSNTGLQRVEVGVVRDVGGGSIVSDGVVSGAGVSQFQQGALQQELRVGSIANSTLQEAQARGIVGGLVSQGTSTGGARDDGQRLRVGTIDESQALSVRTQGSVLGTVNQQQRQGALQRIDVAAVADLGAGGTVVTEGTVSGLVLQTADGRPFQELSVASVIGGAAREASTRAAVSGEIVQSNQGGELASSQRIRIGSLSAAASATTDAAVTAALHQIQSGGSGAGTQEIDIARVTGRATVSARATVQGSVTQTLATPSAGRQRIRIGSVSATSGTVASDAQVSADLLQSGTEGSREDQLMLIGSVD